MDKKALLIRLILTVGLYASIENAMEFVHKLDPHKIQLMLEALDPVNGVEKALYATDTTGRSKTPVKVS